MASGSVTSRHGGRIDAASACARPPAAAADAHGGGSTADTQGEAAPAGAITPNQTLGELAASLGGTPAASAEPTSALDQVWHPKLVGLSDRGLVLAVLHGWCLPYFVPRVLERVEQDPLASGGWFIGVLLRTLMEVPGGFWGRYPELYQRYRHALRAGAAARQHLPAERRLEFWRPLRDVER